MKKTLYYSAAAMCGITLMLTACDKEKNEDNEELPGGKGHILLETTIKNDDGASGSSYLVQIEDFGSKISYDNAIQVGFAATFSVNGNDVYMFPTDMGKSSMMLTRFERSENGLSKVATAQIIPGSSPYAVLSVNENKAYIPLYGQGSVSIINPKSLAVIGSIDLSKYSFSDQSADPAMGLIRDNYMYLTLDQIGPTWMPFEDYRQADVAIIDITADTVVKVISETQSGLCFPTRPFLPGMMFMNENKDIYVACCGYFGYDPTYLKNGFVCIPAGQQEFDPSRTWDISNTVIEGTDGWKPSTVYNCSYIGNGKLVAYVGILELNGDNPYTARNTMAAVIDLNNKTISKINGIPYTDGHSVSIEEYQGKFYFTAYGVDKSGVFSYDPATGAVEHVIDCNSDISYMHIF